MYEAPGTVPVSKFLNKFLAIVWCLSIYMKTVLKSYGSDITVFLTQYCLTFAVEIILKLENWKKEKDCVVSGGQGWEDHTGSPMRSVLHKRRAALSSTPESGRHRLLLKGEGLGKVNREVENVRGR